MLKIGETLLCSNTDVWQNLLYLSPCQKVLPVTPPPFVDLHWSSLIDDHLYSAILHSLEQTHCVHLWFYMSDKLFIARFLNIHRSGILTVLAWLVPHETAAISAQVLCTPYNHAPCHFMQSHMRKVYACLAVTRHLHVWQNDRDLYVLLR